MSARVGIRVSCLCLALAASSTARAQEVPAASGPSRWGVPAPHYQLFRTDIGFGAASVYEQEAYGGSVSVEPKMNILDNLAVGGRVEAMIGGGGNIGGDDVSVKQNVAVATLLKTDFFLTRAAVRPWVGLGIGRYAIVSQGTETGDSTASVEQNAGAYFGVAPQIGVELGGFRIGATYNHIIGAQVEVRQTVNGNEETKKYSHDYATVEIGFRFGGRRR
jgi:hypothetical protein